MMHELIEAISQGQVTADEKEGRYYGIMSGVVTDNSDPQGLGRVKARLGAQGDNESSDWLDPAWIGSCEGIPENKEPVFVAFVDGDPHRGVYWWHPTTKTTKRAQDFMALGTTFVGLFNGLVTQFNALRADYLSHTHPGVQAGGGVSSAPTLSTSLAANKGQASDGSTVSDKSSATVVLSGRAKVK